jgi:tetratricopeptide (TPR) repeat protein
MRVKTLLSIVTVVGALGLGATVASAQVEEELKDCDKHFDRGDLEKAAKACDKAIKKNPSQVPAEAYGKRAAIFFLLGQEDREQLEKGLQFIIQKAEPIHAGAAAILEQKSVILWTLGDKPAAIAVAEEVVKQKPEAFANQNILGTWYSSGSRNEPDKAIAAFEAYLKHRPSSLEGNDVLPRVRLGMSYLRVKRYEDAQDQFETIKKKHRGKPSADVNANNGLCAAYAGLGEWDKAITMCGKIAEDRTKVDPAASVWYNLGVAYLNNKQARQARTAGGEFLRKRQNSAKGHILVGDAYFLERDWAGALESYLKAEALVKAGKRAVVLGIKLGQTYRRLGKLDDAIAKLSTAYEKNQQSLVLAQELGAAYLEQGNIAAENSATAADAEAADSAALATVEKAINGKFFDKASDREKTALLGIAAKALYNRGKYDDARKRYESAAKIKKDVKVKIGLVQTINMQAYQSFADKDVKTATTLLTEALDIDGKSTITNQNLAVIAVKNGKCGKKTRGYLAPLEGSKATALFYHRMMGRVYLCQDKPNAKKASEHFAKAEKEAKAPGVTANLTIAEIYTEWAPLTVGDDLSGSVDKLLTAVQFSSQTPGVANAAKRNLAMALFRRGWNYMKKGKEDKALDDFERATREPALLRGTEPLAFDMSLALAYMEKGKTTDATKIFKRLTKKGKLKTYLKSPYDAVGTAYFTAYANYRSGNAKLRKQAATQFGSLQGKTKNKKFNANLRLLVSSSWEYVAYNSWKSGKTKAAKTALTKALKNANGAMKTRIQHNQAVLGMGSGSSAKLQKQFKGFGGTPSVARVNYGIMLDRAGKPKAAYDQWKKSKSKNKNVKKWMAAKERIFGYK